MCEHLCDICVTRATVCDNRNKYAKHAQPCAALHTSSATRHTPHARHTPYTCVTTCVTGACHACDNCNAYTKHTPHATMREGLQSYLYSVAAKRPSKADLAGCRKVSTPLHAISPRTTTLSYITPRMAMRSKKR